MITLYQTPSAWGIPNISPFCTKLESYFRMAGLAYQTKPSNVLQAPKGKVPYVEVDGKLLGDSQLIIEHLKRTHGDPLDQQLTPAQVSLGHMARRMLEESTYWHIVHDRWVNEEGWRAYRPVFDSLLPPGVRTVVIPLMRRGMRRQIHGQGLGRHSAEEVLEMGKADLSSLSTQLGDKPFLLGESPTSFDASVYGILTGITAFPLDTPLRRFAHAQDNLMRYVERFRERYFKDWKPTF